MWGCLGTIIFLGLLGWLLVLFWPLALFLFLVWLMLIAFAKHEEKKERQRIAARGPYASSIDAFEREAARWKSSQDDE